MNVHVQMISLKKERILTALITVVQKEGNNKCNFISKCKSLSSFISTKVIIWKDNNLKCMFLTIVIILVHNINVSKSFSLLKPTMMMAS